MTASTRARAHVPIPYCRPVERVRMVARIALGAGYVVAMILGYAIGTAGDLTKTPAGVVTLVLIMLGALIGICICDWVVAKIDPWTSDKGGRP